MQSLKLTCFTIFILFSYASKAQEPLFVWAKQMGGKSTDYASQQGIALDSLKNVYTCGAFTDTVDFNPGSGVSNLVSNGNFDIYISKLNNSGGFLWARRIGGTALDYPFCIIADANGNVYLNGYVNGTVDLDPGTGTYFTTGTGFHGFIIKLNSNGNFIWAQEFASNTTQTALQIYFNAMIFAKDGNLIAGGQFGGTVDFDPGATAFAKTALGTKDAYIFKLDTAGNFIWAKTMGGSDDDVVSSLTLDATGNIYSTGHFSNFVDFDPGASFFNMASTGNFDIFIQKLDPNGNFIKSFQMGGGSADYGNSITIDKDANIYTTGQFNYIADFDPGSNLFNLTASGSSGDIFISKLDSSGNLIYALRKGDVLLDNSSDIRTDKLGNAYILGEFNGAVDFNPGGQPKIFTSTMGSDAFLLKLDPTGKYYWLQQYGSSGQERVTDFTFDQNDNIYLAGYFDGTIDMNPGTGTSNFTTHGSHDVFVEKLGQAGAGIITCNGTTTLTGCNASFDDGSGSGNYGNNQNCSWLIKPTGAASINLSFNSFNTEANYDFVKIYNGSNANAPLIYTFSGNTLPASFVSPGNKLFVTFSSDGSVVDDGFDISYSCNTPAPPIANFTATSQTITSGSYIDFTDLSTNNATSWSWSFPGASPTNASVKNPSNIIYNNPGCYDVTLIAVNAFGSDTLTLNCYIHVTTPVSCSELFISEYVEGSGLNKALELYNGSSSSLSLSQYSIKLFANGATNATSTLNLSGTLLPNSVYIVANAGANTSLLVLADTTSGVCNFNGNDAVVLYKNNVGIDAVGIVGNDPGFEWLVTGGSTWNHTLVRKIQATGPTANWVIAQNQWDVFSQDDISDLGTHAVNCGTQASFTYSTPVCQNYSIAFTNTSINATSYQWTFQGGSPATSTQTDPIVQFANTGIKSVKLVAINGTNVDSVTVQINVQSLPNAQISGGPTAFCTGESGTLITSSGTGYTYQWQKNLTDIPGATSVNYNVTTAGSYRVLVTNSNGCQAATGIVPVTVYSKPNAIINATGSTTICSGGSVQLSANTGTNLFYNWKLNNVFIPGATSSTYIATAAGDYNVIITNAHGCSKTSGIISVSVLVTSAVITPQGPTTVCNGTGVPMKANTGNGLTYKWQKGGNIISGATDSTYTAYVTGTYKVIVTSSCATVTSSGVTVTVNNIPTANLTAGGSTTICNGDSVTLSVTTGTGQSYQWFKNGVVINGQSGSSYKAKTTGTYKVIITNANNCTAQSNSIAVTVNAVSASVTADGPTSFCNGDSVTLTANSGVNLSYQWFKNNINIPGATFTSYTTKAAGNFKVKVTHSQNGCTKFSSTVQVVVNCKVDTHNILFETSVSPNPFKDFVTLAFSSDNFSPVTVVVMNAEGQLIEEITTNQGEEITFGKDLKPGFYIAAILQGGNPKMIRLVKL